VDELFRHDFAAKKPDEQLFETMNATDLNNALKELMDGLSVKVFRTYNASITLDRLLHKDSVSQTLEEKKADYDLANKEVSRLAPIISVRPHMISTRCITTEWGSPLWLPLKPVFQAGRESISFLNMRRTIVSLSWGLSPSRVISAPQ
jgi:hypothetical protein